ncbi:hypothetical protein GGX14DRAFT_396574 [Mycena pura]|uniref:Uncharacterized protein n=1 Tax=Mycena pura TaxID=153505 RepID=A0AAD6VB60_9AGAR|nr:hypothetical protein GGX14DRAFT_396574 [Mycena pura]
MQRPPTPMQQPSPPTSSNCGSSPDSILFHSHRMRGGWHTSVWDSGWGIGFFAHVIGHSAVGRGSYDSHRRPRPAPAQSPMPYYLVRRLPSRTGPSPVASSRLDCAGGSSVGRSRSQRRRRPIRVRWGVRRGHSKETNDRTRRPARPFRDALRLVNEALHQAGCPSANLEEKNKRLPDSEATDDTGNVRAPLSASVRMWRLDRSGALRASSAGTVRWRAAHRRRRTVAPGPLLESSLADPIRDAR